MKSVRIRIISCPYFPAFGLHTERYSVCLVFSPNVGKYGLEKIRMGITLELKKSINILHTVYLLKRT